MMLETSGVVAFPPAGTEDSLILQQLFNEWKYFYQNEKRKHLMVMHYRAFMNKKKLLKCYLGWSSFVRYEFSVRTGTVSGRKYVSNPNIQEINH
jgi:hypothetical protein